MVGSFPSSLLDNLLLAFGCGVTAFIISSRLPRSWKWPAFPIVLIGAFTITALVTTLCLRLRYDGYNVVFTRWHLIAGFMIVGSTFSLTLTMRRAFRSGG